MMARHITARRIQLLLGLVLAAGLLMQSQRGFTGKSTAADSFQPPPRPNPHAAFAAPAEPERGESLEASAARDPLGFLKMALERYDRSVRDYSCVFTKQELLGGRLSAEQVMDAYFREKPFSVRLDWKQNADKCSRVLYVADKWIEDGQQMAVVEPAGAIAQLFVSHVMRPISGEDARKNSRRTIDQFGLRNSLDLTLKYALLSQEQNALNFTYQGNSEVDGRTTLVFERRLPYTHDGCPWPDRVLVVHLDRELLLPSLCLAYADDDKKVLLGRYQYSNLKLNTNLADSVFTKEGMGI